jgi:predicted small lipoprotein YifL
MLLPAMLSLLALAACGQKGPLLPADPAASAAATIPPRR